MIENAEFKISTEYDGKKRKLIQRKCGFCDKEFWCPAYRKIKYCSPKCYRNDKTTKEEIKCHQCGKVVLRAPKRIGKNNPHNKSGLNFCSRQCKNYAQSIEGGCKSLQPPHYRNGQTLNKNKHKKIRMTGCVSCGENRIYLLEVHHIDGNRKNNVESNLECVCSNCHKIRHLRLVEDVGFIYDNKYLTDRSLIGVIV